MGCEKAKGGFMSSVRSSMERRRVSNAKVTSLRQRKYQELTMQREHEKLERAKEILERRKSERDRLNVYMHSVGNPHAKHPNHLKGMRRPSTEGMFGRPPWTSSLRSDYETLIKLREKEIAVATLRIENHKQPPNKSTQYSEAKDTNHTNESDESYLPNEEFEFHQDTLQPEFGEKSFDRDHKSIASSLQKDLEDLENLENELFAFANETEKYHTGIGRDPLLVEPTVFREHSFKSLRTGPRSLPPRPPSNPKVVAPPLKSCMKSNRDYQRSLTPLSETPRTFSQALSERISSRTLQSTVVATSNVENAIVPVSNAPWRAQMATTITSRFLNPRGNHQDIDIGDDLSDVPFDLYSEEHPYPQPEEDFDMPALPLEVVMSTVPNVVSSEERTTARVPCHNGLSEPKILRPNIGRHMESECANILSCSGVGTLSQETRGGNSNVPNDSSPTDSVQLVTPTRSTLPPRYTSTSESWQEDRDFELSIPDECQTPPLLSPTGRTEEKNWGSEEESFITSLDSEAATTRLIAEVLAIQSRLEDRKLKPLVFRDLFEEPFYPGRSRSQLEQRGKAKISPTEDLSRVRLPPDGGHELVDGQNEQGVIEVNMQNHEIFTPIDTAQDYEREHTLDAEYREEETTAENAPSGVNASSVDDHEKDILTTAHCGGDRADNFTEMLIFEEMESRKKAYGAAWEIPWKVKAGQQNTYEEPQVYPECPGAKSDLPAKSSTLSSPISCTITTPFKPAGSTLPIDSNPEKVIPSRGLNDQQPSVRHVSVQTDAGQEQSGENPRCHLGAAGISTNSEVLHCTRAENTADLRNASLTSTESTSKYLNIGYKNPSEAPQTRHPKHCFYSSQGLLQVGYSQPRQSPQPVKHNMAQNNRQAQACGFHDYQCDKENYGMSRPDDQELSILASLQRLDWKLAAISRQAMNRTNTTPSLVSQDQTSVQSAPAATGVKGVFPDRTPGTFPVNTMRPSSVSTQKPPTRNFRQRRMVGMTNKFQRDNYNQKVRSIFPAYSLGGVI